MKTREIKELTTNEVQDRLDAEKERLVRMRLNHSISPLDNPAQIRESRKVIARLATELRQRELNNNK
ncbi:MAG: 50S ribosomal protein L29 [Paludibacteraceae bacterium]|jgi:large subunit ribosomal protein L29|nr:50S ribosomal protein L29 [Paludibacteraceae bacterium]MDI9536453.1 50S ribosomal protein L29 [Bacteroidota bacterium]OQC33295.1 MAG: 50S ribosomal protein L29 [Bacteroidetes bacterium ADurb.Bin057]HHT62054.1 50S ribosomal protein L29 [Bacteroidales bacterium]MBP9039567.1 50S ribosomal protein L29 [Paludibacteraceae bacterium]